MTSIDPHALRTAFGSFMTGVSVVTTRAPGGARIGFTANSVASVSRDPPMLPVCRGKFLSCFDAFHTAKHFAVSVLAKGQQELSDTFATIKGDRFSRVAQDTVLNGSSLIRGAVARFSCTTRQAVPAGGHSILPGRIFAVDQTDGLGWAMGLVAISALKARKQATTHMKGRPDEVFTFRAYGASDPRPTL